MPGEMKTGGKSKRKYNKEEEAVKEEEDDDDQNEIKNEEGQGELRWDDAGA